MTTSTSTHTYTRTHTATFLTDVVLSTLTQVMSHLGLNSSRLRNEWAIEYAPAIRAWLAEGSLRTVVLECTTPAGRKERFDLPVEYIDGTGSFRDRAGRVLRYLDKVNRLPSGSTWRIVCQYNGGHTPQPGWGSTSLDAPTGLAMSLGTVGRAPHATVGLRTYGG